MMSLTAAGEANVRKMNRDDKWIRTFEVDEAYKHQKKGYSIYPITLNSSLAGFPEVVNRATVHRSFAEIEKLHSALNQTHKGLYLKGVFPKLPRTSGFVRKTNQEVRTVAEQRSKIKEFLDFAVRHPLLVKSEAFVNFFTPCGERDHLSGTSIDEIIELHSSGNIMDASALSTQVLADQTPTLTPNSDHDKKPSRANTPTTPEEGMQNLPDYLSEAAEDVSKAIKLELEENYEESIDCYRNAIGTLLTSVQQDRCLKRQASVKRRIAQYINKAESLLVEKQKREGLKPKEAPTEVKMPHLDLFGDISDLKRYQIINVLANKVLLAKDFRSSSDIVIKALHKSTTLKKSKKSLLPINIPNMVKLLCYYETDDSLFLVLDYLKFGQIYNAISHIFEEPNGADIVSDDSCPQSQAVGFKNERPPEETETSTENDSDMDIVHAYMDSDNLLCVSNDGIEKISLEDCNEDDFEEMLEERDDDDDDEAEEATESLFLRGNSPDVLLENAENLLSSLNARLSSDDASKAENILKELDSIENSLHTKLDGRAFTPMMSPFRKPRKKVENDMNFQEGAEKNDVCQKDEGIDTDQNGIKSIELLQELSFRPGERLPTFILRRWSRQILEALFALHSRGVIIGDLNPRNLLLDSKGSLVLTYQCEWVSVERSPDKFADQCHYIAPEIRGIADPSAECDFWSLGVILFELVMRKFFVEVYPSGLRHHTPVEVRGDPSLRSVISGFLQPRPDLRLGSGPSGKRDIMNQEFFSGIQWNLT